LVFVGVASASYAIALPRLAPANVSDTYSAHSCNYWETYPSYKIYECGVRNSYPDFRIRDFFKVYFDLLHEPGKTVTISINKSSYSGSMVADTANVVLSSGTNPVFKEYSITASQVLANPSQWDYSWVRVSGVADFYGTAVALTY
jgi:hypothetical protein